MRAWTDYPLTDLGDAPGKTAAVREIETLEYDGDKYITVAVGHNPSRFFSIKNGYVYLEKPADGKDRVIAEKWIECPGCYRAFGWRGKLAGNQCSCEHEFAAGYCYSPKDLERAIGHLPRRRMQDALYTIYTLLWNPADTDAEVNGGDFIDNVSSVLSNMVVDIRKLKEDSH